MKISYAQENHPTHACYSFPKIVIAVKVVIFPNSVSIKPANKTSWTKTPNYAGPFLSGVRKVEAYELDSTTLFRSS